MYEIKTYKHWELVREKCFYTPFSFSISLNGKGLFTCKYLARGGRMQQKLAIAKKQPKMAAQQLFLEKSGKFVNEK